MAPDTADFADMSLDEKLKWLDAIWSSIVSDASIEQMPDWHRELLQKRLHDLRANPNQGQDWREFLAELEASE